MLKDIKKTDFDKVLSENFRLHLDEENSLEVVLSAIDDLKKNLTAKDIEEGRRSPFSLIFTASKPVQLEQGIYKIENENLGCYEIFIVPIGATELEAVFN